MNQYYNSYFKVDMDQVIRNFNKVQNYIGSNTDIIPVSYTHLVTCLAYFGPKMFRLPGESV